MDRPEILARIRSGEISPDQGEELALHNGLAPLRQRDPDPALCDPGLSTTWTPAMCVAWIVWRSLAEVRFELLDFWKDREVWIQSDQREPGKPGWRLEAAPRPRMDAVNRNWPFTPSHSPKSQEAVTAAISALMAKLRNGEVTAQGVEMPGRRPRLIASEEWRRLKHTWRPADGDLFYFTDDFAREVLHVEINRKDVMTAWPPDSAGIDVADQSDADAPQKEKRRTVQKGLIAKFFNDPTLCPDPNSPDDNALYDKFSKWAEKSGMKTVPTIRTFRRHRPKDR